MASNGATKIPEYLALRERAQRRDRLIQGTALVLAVAAVVLAGSLLTRLNTIRKERQLVIDSQTVGTLPPEITLMSQASTLRALAMVMGFIRLEDLKEKGRFFELMQLSTWLCKLAPQYASVWSYNAWNQAYNISVCEYSAEARWLWVQNGIRLIRDQGLKYNPRSVGLYKELGYIYWHKIGDIMDDHHWHYKMELAVEMERILGARPPVLTEEEEIALFRRIAEASPSVEDLIATDAEVGDFVKRLVRAGLPPGASLLAFVARHVRPGAQPPDAPAEDRPNRDPQSMERRLALLTGEADAAPRERLLAALRARELRDTQRMDPAWMLTLMERYGPIDWRTPYAHALYWASYGDMVCKGQLNLNAVDAMNTARFVFFALHNMIQRGRYVLDPNWAKPNQSFLDTLPDPRFVDHLHKAYLEIGKEQDGTDPEFRAGTSGPRYWVGHVNFLQGAIRELFLEGDAASLAKAKEYYAYLREYDLDLDTQQQVKPQYVQPLEQFVYGGLSEALGTSRGTMQFVGVFIARSLKELSIGNVDGAMGFLATARKAYDKYMEDPKTDSNDRRQFEPLEKIYRDVTGLFLQSPGNSPLQKTHLWAALDLKVRQDLYNDLLPYFRQLCESREPAWDVDKAFPLPPGMDKTQKQPPTTRERTRDASEGSKDFNQ